VSGYENNWSDDESFENEGQSQGGKGLRKMLEETLAENKKLLARLDGEKRETDAAALLKAKGLDPALVAIIPEGADPKEWLEKHGALLGVKQAAVVDEEASETLIQVSDDNNDPVIIARRAELAAEQKALADIRDAAESGQPAAVHSDLSNRMDKINTEDELLKFFRENSAPVD
jgi:hypothetical protein